MCGKIDQIWYESYGAGLGLDVLEVWFARVCRVYDVQILPDLSVYVVKPRGSDYLSQEQIDEACREISELFDRGAIVTEKR